MASNASALAGIQAKGTPEVLFKAEGMSFEWVNKQTLKVVALIAGLKNAGLLETEESLIKYQDLREWTRSGESYTSTALLETDKKTITVFAKACVSLGGTASRFNDLMKRREALVSLGIRVPLQYGYFKSASYDEFIEHDLRDVKDKLHPEAKVELAQVAGRLDEAGYSPLGFLRDMRVSGCLKRVYYVDFGFDLGGSDDRLKGSAKHTPCLNQLGKTFHGEDLAFLTDAYWKERTNKPS